MTDDLKERLRIKADMIHLGETIAWGSDVALMHEAVARITDLEASLAAAEAGEDALAKVTDAYKELLANVEGECPSLVDEDSGASQMLLNLMLAAESALAAYEARREK